MSKAHIEGDGDAGVDRFVREPECHRLTGLSRATRWRLAQTGEFPKSLRIGDNSVAWRLSDIQAWMKSKTATETAEA